MCSCFNWYEKTYGQCLKKWSTYRFKEKIEINAKKLQMLSIAHLPISMSFYFVENNIFVDATHLEEQAGLTRITITMNVYK